MFILVERTQCSLRVVAAYESQQQADIAQLLETRKSDMKRTLDQMRGLPSKGASYAVKNVSHMLEDNQ